MTRRHHGCLLVCRVVRAARRAASAAHYGVPPIGGAMIRVHHVAILTAAGLLLSNAGCKRPLDDAAAAPATTQPAASGGTAAGMPAGWKTYTPPEVDFTVNVPGDPTVVPPQREGEQTLRTYVFRKGNAGLNVMLFERTGKAVQRDRPEEIKADPQVVAGTIRDVKLDGMTGLEFQYNDASDGVCRM